jgi:hypothetical protein
MSPTSASRVLGPGELHVHERFGSETICRGAVLWECDWDGGVFESGAFLGGLFRSGTFRGGVVWAAWWKGGRWEGGFWHHGFAPDGAYRPRDAPPGRDASLPEATEAPIAGGSAPRATVFTASVHGDLPRLWLACLSRSLPAREARVEVFDDSADGGLDARLLPGATVLRRTAERPDFQVAYADALRRATTPLVAFVDTDVFWLAPAVWPRVLAALEAPRVAGVACLGREQGESPGTFAVVLKTAPVREVLRSVAGGLTPRVEREEPGEPPGRWRGADTGDRLADALARAGLSIPRLALAPDEVTRFDAITMTRLLGGFVGEDALLELAARNPYFRRGCLGAFALAPVHDALFPEGPRFFPPLAEGAFWRRILVKSRTLLRARRDAAGFARGAAAIRRALASSQPAPASR